MCGQWLCSGRKIPPQLTTPENARRDETNYPFSPHFIFCDDPDVLFGPCGPPAPPGRPGPPGSPGLPPGWPPAPSLAGVKERVGTGNASRERLPLRPSPPELQLFQIPTSDGDDKQPPQCGCYFVLFV